MRVLDELGREIERVAADAGATGRRRRWWRSGAFLVALPLGIAAVAAAATSSILTGEPVRNPPGLHLNPKAGLGVAVGTGRLLDARATDPAGGPDWGVRLVETSRGLGCVQLGRVVGGRIGVLGRDGAFRDDGRFHELGAEVLALTDCQQTDGAGHVFLATTAIGVPDSGKSDACRPPIRASRRPPGLGIVTDRRPACPKGSLRDVFYGLLGPAAKAVTYVDGAGRVVRVPVHGPDGAYVVVKATEAGRRDVGYFTPGVTPASGLRSVEYADGTVCRIVSARRLGGARHCPLKGFVPPRLPHVSRAELAADVHVRVGTRPEHPGPRVVWPKGAPAIPAQRRVTITFRARRAADARSFYTVSTQMRHAGRGCSFGMFGPIARDVTAGTVLRQTTYVPYRCHGTMTIEVGYTQQRRPGAMPFDVGILGDAKVGRVTVRLP